jgi:hypothetical protein
MIKLAALLERSEALIGGTDGSRTRVARETVEQPSRWKTVPKTKISSVVATTLEQKMLVGYVRFECVQNLENLNQYEYQARFARTRYKF